MTSIEPQPPARESAVTVEVVGLVLLVLGVLGLASAAFSWDVRLGVAVLSVAALVLGAWMTTSTGGE